MLVDPNHSLQTGLGDQVITMPVDIRYELEDKDAPGTFITYFTDMQSIAFDITIPGNRVSKVVGRRLIGWSFLFPLPNDTP